MELGNNAPLVERLKRLPLPARTSWDNVADTWEREMKGRDQGLFGDRALEQLAPGGDGLLGEDVHCHDPFRVLDMNGMAHSIRQMQQLLVT